MKIKQGIDFLVIVGPTCSGKTKLSLNLAKKYNGEIINGDSVQVYKKLNIGSAKIKPNQMQGIKHHLLDIVDPEQEYTVYDFKIDCEKKISEIKSKGKLPIIVGGTGLYISSIVYDYKLINEPIDKKCLKELEQYSNSKLYELVKDKCDENNLEIHKNNRVRLINYAYKVKKNKPLVENSKKMKNCQVLCINTNRAELYEKINKRVDLMIEEGLVNEVKQFSANLPSQRAIGYKEVQMYFNDQYTYDEMVSKIKQNTRNFAKKQYTWFKNKMDVELIEIEE